MNLQVQTVKKKASYRSLNLRTNFARALLWLKKESSHMKRVKQDWVSSRN
jgi:hypothetical protein